MSAPNHKNLERRVREVVHDLVADAIETLGENDAAYLQRMYGGSLDRYFKRLAAHGFTGRSHLLDAGCGFGQWALCMATMNERVTALDVSPPRVQFLRKMVAALGLNNLEIVEGALPDSLPPGSFDGIFCYAVLTLVDWKKAISAMCAQLSTGGLLYVNANGLGYFIRLWLEAPNATADYDPRERAVMSLQNTLNYERKGVAPRPGQGQILIDPTALKDHLQSLGAEVLAEGPEGTCFLNKRIDGGEPFFPGMYRSELCVYELIARKVFS